MFQINGVNVERVTHDEAVSLFMKDTKTFKLKIILGAEAIIRVNYYIMVVFHFFAAAHEFCHKAVHS